MEFLDGFKAVEPVERTKQLVKRAYQFGRSVLVNTNVQLCESDHYVREHFTEAPVTPPQGLPPALPFPEKRPDAGL